jgi:ABC-type branched-subunit amino acid transport system substrate-binding protein
LKPNHLPTTEPVATPLGGRRSRALLSWATAVALVACGEQPAPETVPADAIRIGAVLPFSGPLASTGIHLERALMLAVEDVNRAGGVNGRQLHLVVKDSNSGSARGLAEAKQLLEEVSYFVGPEEDHMALDLVGDVKRLDRLHLQPAFTSPTITESGSKGAWLRLVPSALTMGCALATKAVDDGITSTRTIAARDDYHLELATVFSSAFSSLDGRAYPTVTVASGESSYKKAIAQAQRFDADATLMLAYPGTAATIIKEMSRTENVRWYLSPLLRDDALLANLPEGTVTDSVGVSPTFASNAECDSEGGGLGGMGGGTDSVSCEAGGADRFTRHYADRWDVESPLKAAHFYYDAILLLALALEQAAAAGESQPRPQALLPYLTELSNGTEQVAWDSLDEGLALARDGVDLRYIGAAGEYSFDDHGHNMRALVDTWVIDGEHRFRERESVVCRISGTD